MERAKQLGLLVASARKKAGISQKDLGKEIGMEQSSVSDLEKGITALTVLDLLSIARAVQKPLAYFLPETSPNLREDEAELLHLYRDMTAGDQPMALEVMRALHGRKP